MGYGWDCIDCEKTEVKLHPSDYGWLQELELKLC